MRFAHISDNHLGYRQYGLFEREKDFYEVFEQSIDKILEDRPDFVIHSGDLFEFTRPPNKAHLTVQKSFFRLKEKNIPIYAVAGNHDIVMRKNTLPPHVLYKKFGLKVISPKNPYYIKDEIFIGGSPYRSKHASKVLLEQIQNLEKRSQKYKKRILVLHQGIDKYLPFEYELKTGDLPENFNYYAFGHIHNRIVDDYGEGKLAYPGCPEIWRIDELKSYKKNGKGFYFVDLGGDIPEIEKVDLELPREIIQEKVKHSNLDDEIKKLKLSISKMARKPILQLTIEGKPQYRSLVYEKLINTFSGLTLQIRPNYEVEMSEEPTKLDFKSLDIRKLIKERLKDHDDKNSNFAIDLFEKLSDGDIGDAKELASKFYGEFE